MSERRVEYLRLSDLQRAESNPKHHDRPAISASLKRFGYVEAITIDERTGRLVAGHGRLDELELAKTEDETPPDGITVDDDGEWLVPVQRGWASADDAEAQAYLIASNGTTMAGGWDNQALADQLAELQAGPGLDGTGYSAGALDELLASLRPPPAPPVADPEIPPAPAVPVTQPGDVWLLGPHRLICGDCRDPDVVARLLGDELVNVAVTSPPYADRREYDESTSFRPIDPDHYIEWFAAVAANVAAHLAPDGSWFVNIKPSADGLDTHLYVHDLVAAHVREWGWHFATEFCWERIGVPKRPGLRFKNQFEPVYQFTRARWKFRPTNVQTPSDNVPISLGRGDTSWKNKQGFRDVIAPERRPRKGKTSVKSTAEGADIADEFVEGWAYPGNRLPTFVATHEALGHNAAFPVGLPGFFCLAFADPGDIVFDPFTGSGSTLLAAHQTARVGRGCEISPAYVDTTCARFQRHTGVLAVLEATGEPHDFSGSELEEPVSAR